MWIRITRLCIAIAFATTSARAQDDLDQVTPYVGETVIAILRVDAAHVEPEQVVSLFAVDDTAGGPTGLAEHVAMFLTKLRAAGVENVYGVYSLSDIGSTTPYLIVPAADAVAAQKLAADLLGRGDSDQAQGVSTSDYFVVTEAVNSVVFCGSKASRRRLQSERIAERPGLRAAFAAVDKSPAGLVYAPTADQRRVLAELLPQLPDEAGGANGALLASVQWLAAANTEDGRLQLTFASGDFVAPLLKSIPDLLAALSHWRNGAAPGAMANVESSSDGPRGTVTFSTVDGKPTASIGTVVQLFGGLSNQFDSMQSLKQIGLAMHNFHDTWGSFPPSASYDGNKPLLSWRVHLLPWLDEVELYKEFHLNEPWDSEHNRQLIRRMPELFMSHDFTLNLRGKTTYVLPIHEQTMYHGQTGITINDMSDGTSNTIMALQTDAEHAVIWTKPDDLPVDFNDVGMGITGARERFACVFGDGSARRISTSVPAATLKAVLTPAGGEVFDWNETP